MIKVLKQLFCLHLVWNESQSGSFDEFMKTIYVQPPGTGRAGNVWECRDCGKRIAKPSTWQPINYIEREN
jgi:hypothetical protein